MGHALATVVLPQYYFEGTASVHLFSGRNSGTENSVLANNAYVLTPYGTVDIFLKTRGLQLATGEQLIVAVEVRNLLDTQFNQAGSLGVDIPNIGRRVLLRTTVSF